ncbi:probable MBP1 - transcription factor, subunit of the MBF factor [Cephalotrichum gorgonifer]|uniref:Probable MBP1 - transcription factor, subunit of the MBF factor n=1 Tax=Cephalotrichum gorgonifer TaxID=2041049 RepID=A0AAE8MRZ5_9PEZI|nr:probable MBP1 - transcription factor, subunit of the MBF factor [Cephalotrichum gorgonifer]
MSQPNTASGGIYGATYSGIPVYEFLFGPDLKESVMRRRHDDWINATHILKAAGFDKPSRTRILEREVQKEKHEKIQGGYGKYQGTWIPLEQGEALAQRNNVYERLRPIFEYRAGNESPPPAPRHTSKPKQPKKPSVPKWTAAAAAAAAASAPVHMDYTDEMIRDDTPDNLTVASASFMGDDDRFEMSQNTGHRKRKREEAIQDMTEQQHSLYGDELLDYFLLCKDEKTRPSNRPEPPPNFQPNWLIDTDGHTALHWASAMGDVDVIKQLKRFGASLTVKNVRGETPFMHAVNFTNCYEKETFPLVMNELFETVDVRDNNGCTVIHHAATTRNERITGQSCSRHYLDHILNRLMEIHDPPFVHQLVDAQDNDGNTAVHLAAKRNARKCIRSLIGHHASTDIPNNEGIRAEELIMDLNTKSKERMPQRSSSPFGPESQRHMSFRDALGERPSSKRTGITYASEAANTIQTRLTPLIFDKIQDLAQSYDDEWTEKDNAEKEARQILNNTQTELNIVKLQVAELEAQLEPEEVAGRIAAEANRAKYEVQSLISHQNRLQVQAAVDQELAMANGDVVDEPSEVKLDLARTLASVLKDQRAAEAEYVEALSMVGTGEKIEQYRRLLKKCLDQGDAETLDANLDSLIDMMEEEKEVVEMAGQGGEPMDVGGL